MTEFVKYPSIESFANVWRFMNRKMDPTPTRYGAKIKLHGTNGGVRVNADGTVVAQSRSRDLTCEDDNYGFAKWVKEHEKDFRVRPEIMEGGPGAAIDHITYFGEWAGKGIQQNDAVTKLQHKYFFVFAVQINDIIHTCPDTIASMVPDLDRLLVLPWFHVFQSSVDWVSTQSANAMVETINDMVEGIGEVDPFMQETFDIVGTGEGLVLTPVTVGHVGIDRDLYSALLFKAKSEAHRVKASEKAVTVRVEVPESVTEFVTMFVTDARCSQGVEEVCGGIADKSKTSDFLKWVGGDVRKESTAELEEAGLDWKAVAPHVNKAAARWFIKNCEALV